MIRRIGCIGILFGLIGTPVAFDASEEREQRLQEMRKIAVRFQVRLGENKESRDVRLNETPLLRFNDPAREFHDAVLWSWGSSGRPACLLTIEQYGGQSWFELISLTSEKLAVEAGPLKWQPRSAGLALQAFPDAPKPAKEAPRRQSQIKELAARLSAFEVGRTGIRYELRLMPKPLHRYSNPEKNLQDGAMFAFAYGTNPELLAFVELQGETPESAEWQIGFARCGAAELHVTLEDQEILNFKYATQTSPADPYWNFLHKFPEQDK
jgi:hypothetical protein